MTIARQVATILTNALLGATLLLCNFHPLIRNTAKHHAAAHPELARNAIIISQLPKELLTSNNTDLLQYWMTITIYAIITYAALLIILGLVRANPGTALLGTASLILGTFTITIIAWSATAIAGIIGITLQVIHWITSIISAIVTWIIHAITWLSPLLITAAIIFVIIWTWKTIGWKKLLTIIAGIGILYALTPAIKYVYEHLIKPLLQWIGHIIQTILGWITPVIVWFTKALLLLAAGIAALLMITGILGSIGYFLVDQLRTAWQAGKSKKGVLFASFTIGASISIIMMVSAGTTEPGIPTPTPTSTAKAATTKKATRKATTKNARRRPLKPAAVQAVVVAQPPIRESIDRAWKNTTGNNLRITSLYIETMPANIRHWEQATFNHASAPVFDTMLLALTIGISILGLLRGIFSRKELPLTVTFYRKDLLCLAALPLGVVIAVLAVIEGNQDA